MRDGLGYPPTRAWETGYGSGYGTGGSVCISSGVWETAERRESVLGGGRDLRS